MTRTEDNRVTLCQYQCTYPRLSHDDLALKADPCDLRLMHQNARAVTPALSNIITMNRVSVTSGAENIL